MSARRAGAIGRALMLATVLLVAAGCILYVTDSIGLAQLMWVLASGTAGAGIVLLVERYKEDP